MLTYVGFNDEEGKKKGNPITADQSQTCCLLSLIMKFYPYKASSKCKYISMVCMECVKLPLNSNGIYSIIENKIRSSLNVILFRLKSLDDGIKLDIETIKKREWIYLQSSV